MISILPFLYFVQLWLQRERRVWILNGQLVKKRRNEFGMPKRCLAVLLPDVMNLMVEYFGCGCTAEKSCRLLTVSVRGSLDAAAGIVEGGCSTR